jgi:hypothetical protein
MQDNRAASICAFSTLFCTLCTCQLFSEHFAAAQLWVGRLAMAGFLTSVIEEFITGKVISLISMLRAIE